MIKKLEDFVLYQHSLDLASLISDIVEKWNYFYQNSLGMQLVRAADSVPANIAEGYGRYYYNDSKSFYFYARGSLFETKAHLCLATRRGLISKEKETELLQKADLIHKLLNAYIKSIGTKKSMP